MLRVLGAKAAAPVFIIDFLKGLAAVMLSYFAVWQLGYGVGSAQVFNLKFALVGAAVIGHIFPVFAGFRGGKGVATLAGAVMGVYPPAVLLCLATFIVVLLLTRYVSLSSMTAGITLPIYVRFVFHQTYVPLIIFCSAVALLLIFTHRKNIKRLLSGTESKIRFKQAQEKDTHRKK